MTYHLENQTFHVNNKNRCNIPQVQGNIHSLKSLSIAIHSCDNPDLHLLDGLINLNNLCSLKTFKALVTDSFVKSMS